MKLMFRVCVASSPPAPEEAEAFAEFTPLRERHDDILPLAESFLAAETGGADGVREGRRAGHFFSSLVPTAATANLVFTGMLRS